MRCSLNQSTVVGSPNILSPHLGSNVGSTAELSLHRREAAVEQKKHGDYGGDGDGGHGGDGGDGGDTH